jgi:hypothetical protein
LKKLLRKLFEELVVFVIELGKNLRFKVGVSTQVFDLLRPWLKVKTEFFAF